MPSGSAASSNVTTTPAGTVPDRKALVAKLQSPDGQQLSPDLALSNVMRDLSLLEGGTTRQLKQQLDAALQRCNHLGSQLHLQNNPTSSARRVGDFEAMCTSHALLLLPDQGRTSVFHLIQEDILLLRICDCAADSLLTIKVYAHLHFSITIFAKAVEVGLKGCSIGP